MDGSRPALSVAGLVKRFGPTIAVDGVSFEVASGEFLALLGPSGSGKTTILRLLGGFEEATEGRIRVDGKDVGGLPPHRRNIGVVFQHYALFPHMTVVDNVAYPLRRRGVPRAEIRDRVHDALALVDLGSLEARFPRELSGGQQQRVALARALVFRPAMLLMDEPLGALDKQLREHMQREIRSLQQRIGITTVYVTHDQSEAMAMADRIAVMQRGKIEQIGSPRQIYDRPATRFVAAFVGNSNLLSGRLIGSGGDEWLFELAGGVVVRCPRRDHAPANAQLLVRPEKISLGAQQSTVATANSVSGTVEEVTFLGDKTLVTVDLAGQQIEVLQTNRDDATAVAAADSVLLSWAVTDCTLVA